MDYFARRVGYVIWYFLVLYVQHNIQSAGWARGDYQYLDFCLSEDREDEQAWEHFCKTLKLLPNERALLEEQAESNGDYPSLGVLKGVKAGMDEEEVAAKKLFDFDSDTVIAQRQRVRLVLAWI
jgi:hypothetical protein